MVDFNLVTGELSENVEVSIDMIMQFHRDGGKVTMYLIKKILKRQCGLIVDGNTSMVIDYLAMKGVKIY